MPERKGEIKIFVKEQSAVKFIEEDCTNSL